MCVCMCASLSRGRPISPGQLLPIFFLPIPITPQEPNPPPPSHTHTHTLCLGRDVCHSFLPPFIFFPLQVEHIVCDRRRERERFREVVGAMVALGCSAVIDFCAFHKVSFDTVLGLF
jgi:hypothetical protein